MQEDRKLKAPFIRQTSKYMSCSPKNCDFKPGQEEMYQSATWNTHCLKLWVSSTVILVFKRFILIFLPVTFKWMPEIPNREDLRLDWYTWGRLKFGWEKPRFQQTDYWLVIGLDSWRVSLRGPCRKFYLGVLWLYEKQDPELAARVLQDKGGGKTVTCKKLWSITENNFFFFPFKSYSQLPTHLQLHLH